MNLTTIGKLAAAGADAVNSGSFVADADDPKKAYEELVKAFKK